MSTASNPTPPPVSLRPGAVLFVALVAGVVHTTWYPPSESTAAAGTSAAIATALATLASSLLHAHAHVRTARRNGVALGPVAIGILGASVDLSALVVDPVAERRTAAAGPLASAAVGTVLATLWAAATLALARPLVVRSLAWLVAVNVGGAVVSALPILPFDGGRHRRARQVIRGRTLPESTATLARDSLAAGAALSVVGTVAAALGAPGGVLALVLGAAVLSSAGSTRDRDLTRYRLAGLRVRDLMRDVQELPEWTDVRRMHELVRPGAVVVARRWDGASTGSSPAVALLRAQDAVEPLRLGDVVTPLDQTPAVGPDEPAMVLVERLAAAIDGHVLVMRDGTPVGVVHTRDVAA